MSEQIVISDASKFKNMSKIHKYWSRKPWNLMNFMISKHSSVGDVVLDPFCGSGTVGLEAVLLNRSFIGFDLNPFSCLLAENTLATHFDEEGLVQALQDLKLKTSKEILKLYEYGSEYVLYSIPGPANKKNYNLVLGDINLKKTRSIFEPKLNVQYGFPNESRITIPDAEFPKKFYKDRFSYKGVKKISDLVSSENLEALSILWKEINCLPEPIKIAFKLVLTNTILHVSKLKSENIRPLGVNNYWIPDDYINENVYWRFLDRFEKFLKAKREIHSRYQLLNFDSIGSFKIFNETSLPLSSIKDASIDYILTDPPYGDVIQYSELTFIWNTWIERNQNIEEELIINPVQNKDMDYFINQISIFINECYRVLKTNGKVTICFQNKDPEIWFKLMRVAKNSGYSIDSVEAFDYLGSPYNKNWAAKSPKMDLYVTLSKSNKSLTALDSQQKMDFQQLVGLSQVTVAPDGKNTIDDMYSRFIACAIVSIMSGVDVVNISKKELSSFIASINDIGGVNEEYYQGYLFQNI